MTDTDEQQWVEQVRKGKDQAFEQLFKAYYFKLSRFAWRYVDSKAIAEELVQAVFTDIWEDREDWQPSNVKAYLFSSVRNRAIDHLRKQEVRQKHNPKLKQEKEYASVDIGGGAEKKRIQNAIETEIEALPARSKMTFKLHRFDGLTYREIAGVMNVSVKTVESQMTRTLKRLRERLAYLLPYLEE